MTSVLATILKKHSEEEWETNDVKILYQIISFCQ